MFFLADMVFGEFSFFFIRNMTINLLFLKSHFWNMLCFHCNITQAADKNKVLLAFRRNQKTELKIFSKTSNFLTFVMRKENFQNTISAKNFVKLTGCLQPSKCLVKSILSWYIYCTYILVCPRGDLPPVDWDSKWYLWGPLSPSLYHKRLLLAKPNDFQPFFEPVVGLEQHRLKVQVILFEIDCAIYHTNLHELFCQFISWTNWLNSGKSMDNCWLSCQVMAVIKKFTTIS